jgi:hypothetical protein
MNIGTLLVHCIDYLDYHSFIQEKERAEQRACEEPPCTVIELIGKTLIQFHGCV